MPVHLSQLLILSWLFEVYFPDAKTAVIRHRCKGIFAKEFNSKDYSCVAVESVEDLGALGLLVRVPENDRPEDSPTNDKLVVSAIVCTIQDAFFLAELSLY